MFTDFSDRVLKMAAAYHDVLTHQQRGSRKSQNRYISPPCGGAISQLICTKFGEFVDLIDIITPAKIFISFPGWAVEKKNFPFRNKTAYITVPRAAALACDKTTTGLSNYVKQRVQNATARLIMNLGQRERHFRLQTPPLASSSHV